MDSLRKRKSSSHGASNRLRHRLAAVAKIDISYRRSLDLVCGDNTCFENYDIVDSNLEANV